MLTDIIDIDVKSFLNIINLQFFPGAYHGFYCDSLYSEPELYEKLKLYILEVYPYDKFTHYGKASYIIYEYFERKTWMKKEFMHCDFI